MSTNPNVNTSISCLLIIQELLTPMDANSLQADAEFLILDPIR